MQTGTKISGAAHLALIGWALLGGAFRSEPLPYEVHEVSLISAQDFAALGAPSASDAPQVSQRPPARPEPAPEPPADDPAEPPVAEAPDLTQETAALPPQPEVPDAPEAPLAQPEPRPAERVAPDPVAPPPVDAAPDTDTTPAVVEEDGAQTDRDAQEATAPEEAGDRIETEANERETLAPLASARPVSRPDRRPAPDPQPDTTAEPRPEPPVADPDPDTNSAIEDALAAALADGGDEAPEPAAPAAPTGPPLTAGEREGLRVAVSRCWNVGSLSSEALRTTVVVGVSMARDGVPVRESIRMLSASGGSGGAAEQAFEAARRAIIRCGARGFDLPAEKFDQWRDIEMTFNPERMQIK
ncbi:energy transducer TonB [Pukyongiella litopenaei]|uniref:Energy transducer TonB n=1 Tax=Pukyongiella litopenaei TaxID=2605946 RepID=A0A2S0MLP5_9RHOB|nr:energy transducer TonB [Pukyongiella litopenaei]AVO36796.1 energy transducer TonB [Pukyongiella litopenaei]